MVETGTREIGPDRGRVTVHTRKQGMLKALGHDLTLEVRDWRGTVDVSSVDPFAGTAVAELSAGSLHVVGPDELGDDDRAEIRENVAGKVLHPDRHPKIRFEASLSAVGLDLARGGAARLTGQLTLHGRTAPQDVEVTVTPSGETLEIRGEACFAPSSFGIPPFKAPLGVLKVRDEVRVRFELTLR